MHYRMVIQRKDRGKAVRDSVGPARLLLRHGVASSSLLNPRCRTASHRSPGTGAAFQRAPNWLFSCWSRLSGSARLGSYGRHSLTCRMARDQRDQRGLHHVAAVHGRQQDGLGCFGSAAILSPEVQLPRKITGSAVQLEGGQLERAKGELFAAALISTGVPSWSRNHRPLDSIPGGGSSRGMPIAWSRSAKRSMSSS